MYELLQKIIAKKSNHCDQNVGEKCSPYTTANMFIKDAGAVPGEPCSTTLLSWMSFHLGTPQ